MLIKIEIYMRTTHETIDFLSYEIIETEKLAFYANFNIFQCLDKCTLSVLVWCEIERLCEFNFALMKFRAAFFFG